jgi:hypothetical protein
MSFCSLEGSVAYNLTFEVQSGKWGNSLIPAFEKPDSREFPRHWDGGMATGLAPVTPIVTVSATAGPG